MIAQNVAEISGNSRRKASLALDNVPHIDLRSISAG
jgi:hypothetical protein